MGNTEQAACKATHCVAPGKTLFAYQWECVGGDMALIEMYLLVVKITQEVGASQAMVL